MSEADRRIRVARIGAPHGVRGEVRLWSFTADPASVKDYGELSTADGKRSFAIETMRPAKDCFVARLRGVADRTAAEALRNIDLYVPRERLPPPDDDSEFYHADLIGLPAFDQAGQALGTVIAVLNFGAGDLLELRRTDSSQTVMVPFTAAAVPVVDIEGRRIVIDPPEGLF